MSAAATRQASERGIGLRRIGLTGTPAGSGKDLVGIGLVPSGDHDAGDASDARTQQADPGYLQERRRRMRNSSPRKDSSGAPSATRCDRRSLASPCTRGPRSECRVARQITVFFSAALVSAHGLVSAAGLVSGLLVSLGVVLWS